MPLPNRGGVYSFTYSVANPADDGAVSCAADASWISDVTDSGSSVSFSVAENTTVDTRTGHVVLYYSSSYGTVSQTVTVAQNSGSEPELTVQPTAVAAAIEGGTYSFTYTITNAASDGELSCVTDAEWISGFDYSVYGTVSFTVAANESTSLREAEIEVFYDYGDGGEVGESVTVVQDHEGGSGGSTDIDAVIGTYTITGIVNGQSISYANTTWTMVIRPYTGSDGAYDLDIDGIVPHFYSETYGKTAYAAANYVDGTIVIPTQCTGRTTVNTSSATYYLGFTPVTDYENGSFYYSSNWPSTTLTYDSSTATWTSDYGMFAMGCTTANYTSFSGTYFQAVGPAFTIQRTSTSYEVSDDVAVGQIENVHFYNAYKAE